MPARTTYLTAVFNGVALQNILSASCRYGWKQNVPDATISVPADPFPGQQLYDQAVTISMGAGHNIVRFSGVLREYDYSLWPRALGLVFRGYLVRALEYQNHEDPTAGSDAPLGGIRLLDLTGEPWPKMLRLWFRLLEVLKSPSRRRPGRSSPSSSSPANSRERSWSWTWRT